VSVINDPSLFSATLTNVLYFVYLLFLCVRCGSIKERSLSDNSLVSQCRNHVTLACFCVCVCVVWCVCVWCVCVCVVWCVCVWCGVCVCVCVWRGVCVCVKCNELVVLRGVFELSLYFCDLITTHNLNLYEVSRTHTHRYKLKRRMSKLRCELVSSPVSYIRNVLEWNINRRYRYFPCCPHDSPKYRVSQEERTILREGVP
jgi:hypothetical protein